MNSEGTKNISEKLLDNGSLFGLKFNEGFVFLEVDDYEQVKFAPFTGFDSIGADSSSVFQRLEDDNGDDILYLETGQLKVMHTSIGHTPAVLRRYDNYPESQTRLRQIDNLGAPTPGDNYGYIDGEDSPYSSPSDAEEFWIPPGVHLDFAFNNPDDEAHTPVLNILSRIYRVNTLDPSVNNDLNAIRRIVQPGSPMPIVNAGGPDSQVDYDLQDTWRVRPVSESEVNRIKRGDR